MATPRFPPINWDEAAHKSATMRAMGPAAFDGAFAVEQSIPTFEPIDWSRAAFISGRAGGWVAGATGACGCQPAAAVVGGCGCDGSEPGGSGAIDWSEAAVRAGHLPAGNSAAGAVAAGAPRQTSVKGQRPRATSADRIVGGTRRGAAGAKKHATSGPFDPSSPAIPQARSATGCGCREASISAAGRAQPTQRQRARQAAGGAAGSEGSAGRGGAPGGSQQSKDRGYGSTASGIGTPIAPYQGLPDPAPGWDGPVPGDYGSTSSIPPDGHELPDLGLSPMWGKLLSYEWVNSLWGDDYWVLLLEVSYPVRGGKLINTTYMRMCVPGEFQEGERVGLVVLVTGTQGVGVEWSFGAASDDLQMAALASGGPAERAAERTTATPTAFGRTNAPPMAVVSYNNPGFGGTLRADPSSDFEDFSPNDQNGDEFCGPQSHDALAGVVKVALDVMAAFVDASTVRLIVSSFSNGVTCATGWLKDTSEEVHAFIDAEGPTDSAEQTLSTECFSPFGAPGLPPALTYPVWADCTDLPSVPDMRKVFAYYWRPPDEVLDAMIAAYDAGEELTWPVDVTALYGDQIADGTVRDPSTLLLDSAEFWNDRRPLDFLSERKGAYIRVQTENDHVQPQSYHNRHAVRAMLAAAKAGCGVLQRRMDVYFADQDYMVAAEDQLDEATRNASAPLAVSRPGWDADDALTFPEWPDKSTPFLAVIRTDLARWALLQDFDSGCTT